MPKNNNTPSLIRLWLRGAIIKFAVIAAIIAVATAAIVSVKKKVTESSTPATITKNEVIDITPTQIRHIESIGEWEFLTIADEELVDTTRHGFFGDDQLVRIYYGTLRLGINLREAHEGWIAFDGDTLRATLPPVRLLSDNFIDETRTRSFIQTGKWTHNDRKAMYMRAATAMRRRCLTQTNFQTARQNAVSQFTQLLHSMGYDKTSVTIDTSK